MAVTAEQFERADVSLSGDLRGVVDSILRRKDGTWVFLLKLDGEATLPDGRRIRLSRHFNMAATEQIGRKGFRR